MSKDQEDQVEIAGISYMIGYLITDQHDVDILSGEKGTSLQQFGMAGAMIDRAQVA